MVFGIVSFRIITLNPKSPSSPSHCAKTQKLTNTQSKLASATDFRSPYLLTALDLTSNLLNSGISLPPALSTSLGFCQVNIKPSHLSWSFNIEGVGGLTEVIHTIN